MHVWIKRRQNDGLPLEGPGFLEYLVSVSELEQHMDSARMYRWRG